ncbi:hypothetical protein [Streptomyces sp. NPDC004629]|uniref:hypothetical protein n=1 Tax=Streptomyces sp. NPDC004629 TaxID=3364705 RepID=UPI0036B8D563
MFLVVGDLGVVQASFDVGEERLRGQVVGQPLDLQEQRAEERGRVERFGVAQDRLPGVRVRLDAEELKSAGDALARLA